MLDAQLKKMIENLQYSGLKQGFMFSTYIKCHKTVYQSMLALAKKINYTAYDSICVCHFLHGTMDPTLAQAKLSIEANNKKYCGDFDATIEYLMNQVSHHQVNQQLNNASVVCGDS